MPWPLQASQLYIGNEQNTYEREQRVWPQAAREVGPWLL